MPIYMIQGRYSQGAIKNLVSSPEDRTKAAAAVIKAAGGKLLNYYMSFGDYDFVAISDFPGDEAAMACSMAVGAPGHVTGLKTTKLFTGAEAVKAMTAAGAAAASMVPPKGK